VIFGLPTRLFVLGQLWGISTLAAVEIWDKGFTTAQHSLLVWLLLVGMFAIGGYCWSRGMMWFLNRAKKKANEKGK
jgi:hypothetical protein